MNKIKYVFPLIALLSICSCSKVSNSDSDFESKSIDGLPSFEPVDVDIYNKKYYRLPNDLLIEREISLSASDFIYIYRDVLTSWHKSNSAQDSKEEASYQVKIQYYSLVDDKIFLAKEEPHLIQYVYLNEVKDLTDEIIANFYNAIPKEKIHFYEPLYNVSENLIYYRNNRDIIIFAAMDAANELGAVFVE